MRLTTLIKFSLRYIKLIFLLIIFSFISFVHLLIKNSNYYSKTLIVQKNAKAFKYVSSREIIYIYEYFFFFFFFFFFEQVASSKWIKLVVNCKSR